MPDVSWKYCPTDENPADLGTRGKTPKQLQESKLWWKGASWLCTAQCPHQPHIDQMHYEGQEEEIQPVLQVQTKVESSTGMSAIIKLEEFSSRYRLLRVTAWVLKFVDCLKRKRKCKTSKLMIYDIKGAEKA